MVKIEPEHVFAVVALVVIVLLLCIRRRRRRGVAGAGAGGGSVTRTTEVKEEFISSTSSSSLTQSARSSQLNSKPATASVPAAEEGSNSLLQLFRATDVEDIMEKVSSLDDVSVAIRKAGLESCNLIFGIDYTGSNYMQGKKTFGGKCLHNIEPTVQNPYQKVICILGETLEPFDDDGNIPTYGFGDTFTRDHSVFSLCAMGSCKGFQDVLTVYNDITPRVRLGGPTNFAPLINQALDIVKKNKSFHILVIVADGQVTAERDTNAAIVEASNFPLSIIMVGVGDGPWDMMNDFELKLPARRFDNFHFLNLNQVTNDARNPNASFALHALKHLPDQYKTIVKLGLLDFNE